MLIVSYVFLGIGAAVSCFLSFWWLKVEKRLNVIRSCIVGMLCGLVVCLNLNIQMSRVICFLFLITYIAIVMQVGGRAIDMVAAVSLACGAFGMLQMTIATLLQVTEISLFFRVMLIVIGVAGIIVLFGRMSGEFPDEGWQELFVDTDSKKKSMRGLYMILAGYGLSLAMPVISGIYSISVLLLEWFTFLGGLKFINLLILSRKEKMTLLTEKQYRDDMQTYMSVIRSQRHDYNFHVQTLHGLLLRKDYGACEEYLGELLKDSISMNQLLPLEDAAISALILSFQSKAAQSGIRMEIDIENDLSQIVTNVYETNKVIGNLLQNAIDETEVLPDKSYGIKLSILKRGEFCIINVSNRTLYRNPMQDYHIGHSEKNGHEGIGIASIQALVARYGGVVYSRMEKDIIFFVAKLPLQLGKEGS
ncbi:GHKL domain-containing protein [Roseburia hominis]